jgi:hypothetical protein
VNAKELRDLSIETSAVAIRNVAMSNHTGLVTLHMEHGVVRSVWAGTEGGLLLWRSGKTVVHVVPNVEGPLDEEGRAIDIAKRTL